MTEAIFPLTSESPISWQLQAGRSLHETPAIQRLAAYQQRAAKHVIASLMDNTVALRSCMNDMAQLRRAANKKLPLNLQVAEVVHGLPQEVAANGVIVSLEHEKRDGGVLSITVDTRQVATDGILERKWQVSAFAKHHDVQRYSETVLTPSRMGFEPGETTEGRPIQPQDVVQLQRLVMLASMAETMDAAPLLAATAD